MSETTASRSTTINWVNLIIAQFVTLIVCLVLLDQIQMYALTAVRAFVGGEGLWAKAQKDAIRSLEHYVISGDEADYQSYRRFIQVPLGDMKARIELQKPNPNLGLAREGLLKGRNHPADIERLISFFLRFQHTEYLTRVIGHWTAADQLIAELNGLAEQQYEGIASGRDKPEAVRAHLARLEILNLQLTEEEDQFSSTVAEASRWASGVSRNLTYAIALLFVMLGVGTSRFIVTRIRATENALLESEEQFRSMFDHVDDVIFTVASDGTFSTISPSSERMIGWSPDELISRPFAFLIQPDDLQLAQERFMKAQAGESVPIFQVRMLTKAGGYLETEILVNTIHRGGSITILGVARDITEHKRAEEQIAFLAYRDALTGLPNRRRLVDRLPQALDSSARSGCNGALLFLDLDNFKTLNDTLGHDKGDLLLQQVAQRLAPCVRESDTVARLGGDEFVVLLEGLSENNAEAARQAETVGEKVLSTLNQPYLFAGYEISCTASIGITLFSGQQTLMDELLKQADLAMYQSKTAGRNTLRFFDPEMQLIVTNRAALETDLREAVRQQQFVLYYQPQVGDDGSLIGAEALVRWQHPQRGMVSPAEFIPLAEETGLILPLGQWVMETGCAQLAKWAVQPNMADLFLAVNVSAKQFQQADFVDQVMAALGRTGANPHRLKLELTESLLLSNVENTIAKMTALKAQGVGFALDDFGTGYSSLSYLKRLPLDQLKIDQAFVRDILIDPNDAAIAKLVIALAESLGLTVIAEGVESEAQKDFLASLGCDAYQGYLFSRPLPLHAFEEFRDHWQSDSQNRLLARVF